MKKHVALAAGVSALFFGICPATFAETEKPVEMKVMTFNIRYLNAHDGENNWRHRAEFVFDVIREHSPDVIGLQEALRPQLDDVRKAFPEYATVGEGRDGGTEGEYAAILYRHGRYRVSESGMFWLSETPDIPSAHWGNRLNRICTWARLVEKQSDFACTIYNTHWDHQSQPSRKKSARLIADRIRNRSEPNPFVLMGDFNAGENNAAIDYLTGQGRSPSPVPAVDTYRVMHPDEKDVGTFNRFRGDTGGEKIDYILVPPNIQTLSASIIRTERDGRYPSDHFPVTARLRFEDSAATNDMGSFE